MAKQVYKIDGFHFQFLFSLIKLHFYFTEDLTLSLTSFRDLEQLDECLDDKLYTMQMWRQYVSKAI